MKKTIIVIAIASALLAAMLAGCRPIQQAPGVTAIQSALPTLPYASPSPVTTPGGTAGVIPTAPMTSATAGTAATTTP